MSAERLAEAAARIRQDCERVPGGPWGHREAEGWNRDSRRTLGTFSIVHDGQQEIALIRGFSEEREGTAGFMASWHPAVALAVADWLEAEIRRIDLAYDTYDWTGHPGLAVADAFLGGT